MQFTKLRSMELKHSAINHFCLQSYGNNIVVENPVAETVVLQLNNEPDVAECFPYDSTTIEVPQDQPATKLLRGVDLRQIYDKSSVLEQQELGLDPVFVAECSFEPVKPRLLHVQYSPLRTEKPMLAVISTYGSCHILTKNSSDRSWKREVGNLTKLLISEVFTIDKSPCDCKTFKELKHFINSYVITACSWHCDGSVIFAANAAGFIVAFENNINSIEKDATEQVIWTYLSKVSADIGRICYLKAFDDFLIAVSAEGVISLFKWTVQAQLEYVETLWNQKDLMSCRQIAVQKCKNDNSYMILFAKGAHVICSRISSERKLEGCSSLYVPGVKITGLELFHENELIITTITGNIFRLTFSSIREKGSFVSIRLKVDKISISNFDMENIQILGVGTSFNKALWAFMAHRNKELVVSSKQSVLPSYLILCKPSTIDPLAQLNNIPIDKIDPYYDLITALRLDVWHSNVVDKYDKAFSNFLSTIQHETFDDSFLRKMQIQYEMARVALRRSSYKLQFVDEAIASQIDFLECATQIVHIILRLEYLQGLLDNERIMNATAGLCALTEFQQRAVYSMRKNFNILIEKLNTSSKEILKKDEIIKIQEATLDFVDLALRNMRSRCQDFEIIENTDLKEKCLLCESSLNEEELVCALNHNLKRCCVSYVQLPLFNNKFCPQCGTMALDDKDSRNVLAELFPPGESVKCTFCRSNFVNS